MNMESGGRYGEFVPRRLIGRGGMGEVYEAYQESLGRVVALKVLPAWMSDDPTSVDRFQMEAATAARLDHPNIVPIYAFGESAGRCYFAMKLVRGLTIGELIKRWQHLSRLSPQDTSARAVANAETVQTESARTGPPRVPLAFADHLLTPVPSTLDAEDLDAMRGVCLNFLQNSFCFTAKVGEQLARALAYAHEYGQVHRDIKPSNAMIDRHGQVYLIDFGLTRALTQTVTHPAAGTPRYLSPEQLDYQDLDYRTDIYSLGITLYELAARCNAFEGSRSSTLARAIRTGGVRPLDLVAPGIPKRLAQCIHRAMQPDRNSRFQSAREFADELRDSVHEASSSIQPATIPDSTARRDRRRWLLPLTAACGLILLLGSTSYVTSAKWMGFHIQSPGLKPFDKPELQKWVNLPIDRGTPIANAGDLENAIIDIDLDRQQLRMDTRGLVLLPLGSVSGNTYKVQIGFRQNNWTGGFGVYFGFHTELLPNGETVSKYQELRLLQRLSESEGPKFFLHRRTTTLKENERGMLSETSRDIAWTEVNVPDPGEQILEFIVGPPGLTKVRWAGQDQPDLTATELNARFQPSDYDGYLGVSNYRCATLIGNARMMFMRRLP